MAFRDNEIAEVRYCGTLLGVEFCVVLHFRIEFPQGFGGTVSVTDLLDGLEQVFFTQNLLDSQVIETNWNAIELRNLSDLNVFGSRSVDYDGESAGDALPAFVAGGFRKDIGTRITRPGSMRLPGISDGSVTDGVWNPGSGFVSWANAIRRATITVTGGDIVLQMVVVGRGASGGYDLQRINPVVEFLPVRITTQNSRKS